MMKRVLTFILFIFVIILVGCDQTPSEYNRKYTRKEKNLIEYQLEVEGAKELILEELNDKYNVGDKVIIKMSIIDNADVHLYVNDEFVCSQTVIEEGGSPSYWELSFIMPDQDSKIELKTSGEFEETQKIIYYDREVAAIWYRILFNYDDNESMMERHKDFIEASGLNKLDYSDIFYFNTSPYISIVLKPEQETIEVSEFIYKLKQKYSSIISIERKVEYFSSKIYMHNPKYYGFENQEPIPFVMNYVGYLPKGIYTKVEDIENAIKEIQDNDGWKYVYNKEQILDRITTIYNEEYFEKHILVITDTIVTGSGSNRQTLEYIYLKDNTLYIFVKMYYASIGTCDMQYKTFGLTLDRSLFEDVDNLEQILLWNEK